MNGNLHCRRWSNHHLRQLYPTGSSSTRNGLTIFPLSSLYGASIPELFGNVNVTSFNVREGGTKGVQSGYPISPEGLEELRLWSRDWEKKFFVEGFGGRASCSWAEYESGMAGVELPDDARRARILAYEEVLAFLSTWAVATKRADALVEVSVPFRI
ncbi:hypothetical protein JAAARDRAFT_191351 [Jaapia argillacea MUCL 33604]|uniref:Vacuolar membrane protease C-terminal domain-containing protein n=1 Tax=Jaapia argillacea MUCL 33604 TaxID=933084 RepID=A0A067Q523_9AGAM|nr:hypothetical protein JAAARDRAFT_191351 [Jaapia argillacea MUCL 33604]